MAILDFTSQTLINATELNAPQIVEPFINILNTLFILIGGFFGIFVLNIAYRVWAHKRLYKRIDNLEASVEKLQNQLKKQKKKKR
ncbi:MAG: hypothetical protein GY861_08455 [bacterium]|nr:hypothetical protein [bacterium]